jgi:hypothetical protein
MGEVRVVESNAQYSSLHAIWEVALPACILNGEHPACLHASMISINDPRERCATVVLRAPPRAQLPRL